MGTKAFINRSLRTLPILSMSLLLLTGCGIARQQEAQQRQSAAIAEAQSGMERCNETFPKSSKTAVARAHCISQATSVFRTVTPYPDLFDQETAARNMLAEKWQNGLITQSEYDFQFSQIHSQIASEEQRRNLSSRSVAAQETTAAAASSPVVCNRVGSTTICN